MSAKSKNNKKDQTQAAPQQFTNAIQLKSLSLIHLPQSTNTFDFTSILFKTYLKSTLSQLQNIQVGETLTVQIFGENEQFKVLSYESPDPASTEIQNRIVGKDTEITIKSKSEQEESDGNQTDLEEVERMFKELQLTDNTTKQKLFGGYKQQLDLLKEVIDMKIVKRDNPMVQIKGVLVHGPSGIGKTLAIETLLNDYKVHKLLLTPKHLVQSQTGMLKRLQDAFKLARMRQPSILVIEEIDFIANSKGQGNKELFYTFLSELDQIDATSQNILVIATTNKIDDVDKSLRRGGRLDIDIRFDMPQAQDRFEILTSHLNQIELNKILDQELLLISRAASGFVGSDLAQIVRNAHLRAIKENNGELIREHLESCIIEAKPLSIQDLIVEVPKVHWNEIGGNEDIKFQVRQCVEWPLKYPHKFEAMGLKPPAGILLYGPPGCSKTMIAKALATESGLNFIAIKGPELFSKYVGDTEKAIREIFRKAKLSSPSIIFFDEIDAMATQRGSDDTSVSDRALCQLLNEMDGVESRAHVIVVAATNRLDIIDSALLRPGRFDRLVHVPLPSESAREQILRINISKMKTADAIDFNKYAKLTDGMSGAEITLICREAGLKALTENSNIEKESMDCIAVTSEHIEKAIFEVRNRGKMEKLTNGQSEVFNQPSLFKQ